MDEDQLKENGWEPWPYIAKTNAGLERWVDADEQVVIQKQKLLYQEEKCHYLEGLVKSINNRGFAIKNALD